jgi:hypothetical protein
MRSLSAQRAVVILGMALATASYGCSEECSLGQVECVDNALIRACIDDGDDDTKWFVSPCTGNTVCESKKTEAAADSGALVASLTSGEDAAPAACVGACATGKSECVNDELSRLCVGGGEWQLDACGIGEKCIDGSCKLSAGGVSLCKPKEKACASERVEKVCDEDGSAWIEAPCANNESCTTDECAPSATASCDVADSCDDNKTAIQCLGKDKGFEIVKCPGDSYCQNGECRGTVCAVGTYCTANRRGVRECVDGSKFNDVACGDNEICVQDGHKASCKARICWPDAATCGDPRDPSVDPKKNWTVCSGNTDDGVPNWVTGQCGGLTECDPSWVGSDTPCRQECTPKAMTCGFTSDSKPGTRTCKSDGTWGDLQVCPTSGDVQLQCERLPELDASKLSKAVCATTVCAAIFDARNDGDIPATVKAGACDGTQVRECQSDGTLGAATSCGDGKACVTVGSTTADGNAPGVCEEKEESAGCGTGQVEDCFGNCASTSDLDDGNCDSEFDCSLFSNDFGDCASSGCTFPQVEDCYGDCTSAFLKGDDSCDWAFDCAAHSYDDGDCSTSGCTGGDIEDCYGDCTNEDWLGDNYCDDEFNCNAFSDDYGDCDGYDGG